MCIGWLRLRKYSYIYRVIYLIVIKMLKVVAFMKQVAKGLQMEGNFGTAHVYRSSLNAIIAYRGKGDFTFHEVTPEWLKGFEIHLRGRGCSWNTVSTYLRTFRAVYNRAVDCRGAVYVPHLFRSVYTGTRADRKRALDTEDIQKVFTKLPQSSAVTSDMRRTQELFVLMFLLRGLPFVDLAYLRKSDLHDNVITYRRRKTGRPLSVTLTPEAMAILKRYMNRDTSSPYLFPLLNSREGTKEAYHEYQLALRNFNRQLMLLGEMYNIGLIFQRCFVGICFGIWVISFRQYSSTRGSEVFDLIPISQISLKLCRIAVHFPVGDECSISNTVSYARYPYGFTCK